MKDNLVEGIQEHLIKGEIRKSERNSAAYEKLVTFCWSCSF